MDDLDEAPLTWEEAQEIHEMAQASDPDHDDSSCWCCCSINMCVVMHDRAE